MLEHLGLEISCQKLVVSAERAVCLVIQSANVQGIISIPVKKLVQIKYTIIDWLNDMQCTRISYSLSSVTLCSLSNMYLVVSKFGI